MCQKIGYLTKIDAAKDAVNIKNSHKRFSKRFVGERKANRKMIPYLCDKCGMWHLTTMTKRKHQ